MAVGYYDRELIQL